MLTQRSRSDKCRRCGHGRTSSRGCDGPFHDGKGKSTALVKRSGTRRTSTSDTSSIISGMESYSLHSGQGYFAEPAQMRVPLKVDLRKYEKEIGLGGMELGAVEATLITVSEMPRVPTKRNLYYLVVPAGGGKTYLSENYGFLDIDSCVGRFDRNYLAQAISMCCDTSPDTKLRAKEWMHCVRSVFRAMQFSKPTLLLVHDDVTGWVAGGRKIGGANVKLSEKLRMEQTMKPERRKLIEINESIFSKMNDQDRTFESHDQLEMYVLERASRMDIQHAGAECQQKVGFSVANEMTHRELIEAFRAGRVTKEYVDKRAIEDREIQKNGFGIGMNTWAMAMAGAFYGACRREDVKLHDSVLAFEEHVNWTGHLDAARIKTLDIPEEDRLKRLGWWLSYGKFTEKSEFFFRILSGVGREADAVFTGLSLLLSKSRFLFDEELSDSDRVSFMTLGRLYGFRGEAELYEEKAMEERDKEDRIHRHARQRSAVFLSKPATQLVADMAQLQQCDEKITHAKVCEILHNWDVRSVAALFETIRKLGSDIRLGTGGNAASALLFLIDQESHRIDISSLDWRSREMFESPCGLYPGIGGVVMEKGLAYVLKQGKYRRQDVSSTVLEQALTKGIPGGENGAEENVVSRAMCMG